jgi:hypothetical protein
LWNAKLATFLIAVGVSGSDTERETAAHVLSNVAIKKALTTLQIE